MNRLLDLSIFSYYFLTLTGLKNLLIHHLIKKNLTKNYLTNPKSPSISNTLRIHDN